MQSVKLAYDLFVPKDGDSGLCPVITAHGLFMNKIMLSEMSKKIADSTGRKVYCVDLRNHGDSPSPSESNCYFMAEDLIQFLKDHNIPKASFVCHSFSTRVATIVAIDEPHMVEKLIFMDFYPYGDLDGKYNDFTKRIASTMRRTADTLDILNRGTDEVKNELSELLSKNKETGSVYKFLELLMTEFVVEENEIRLKYDREATLKFFLEGRYRLPPYGIYDGPVHLIVGEMSSFCKKSLSNPNELKKYFPKVEVITIAGGTHLLPVEKPEECAEAVKNCLEK